MRKRQSGFGWVELAVGIVLILLGIFTFIRPGSMLTGIVVVYGVIAVTMGVLDIITYVKIEKYTGFGFIISLVTGILSVMCGVMLVIFPNAGMWVLSLLFPIWFIAHCISRLCHMSAVSMGNRGVVYYVALAMDIIGLILGIVMVFRPVLTFLTLRVIGYLVAAYLIVLGIESIAEAASR